MAWTVKADNEILFATGVPTDAKHTIINPVLVEEINSAGSFSCEVPFSNELYNKLKLRTTTIEVYKDSKIYWRGRPLLVEIGYNRTVRLTCEGALAFLNDTVYPPDTCKLRLTLFLDKVLANHNERCNVNRQIHMGTVTVDDVEIEYNGSYTQTMDVIKDLIETYGGYLITHYAEGGSYFDWLKSIPTDPKETINVENVVDISKAISAEDICTCVIPVGKDNLTIGTEHIENEAASALFGRVWQCVEFNEIEDPDALYTAGAQYLNNNLWSNMQLDISAANIGNGYKVGFMYHARIPSFNINHDIALTSAEISLVDASATKYSFSAATIWTQINAGKDLTGVIDSTQALRAASVGSLSSRTAKMEKFVNKAKYYTGDVLFSDGTKLTFVNGMATGGKSTEGDF